MKDVVTYSMSLSPEGALTFTEPRAVRGRGRDGICILT